MKKQSTTMEVRGTPSTTAIVRMEEAAAGHDSEETQPLLSAARLEHDSKPEEEATSHSSFSSHNPFGSSLLALGRKPSPQSSYGAFHKKNTDVENQQADSLAIANTTPANKQGVQENKSPRGNSSSSSSSNNKQSRQPLATLNSAAVGSSPVLSTNMNSMTKMNSSLEKEHEEERQRHQEARSSDHANPGDKEEEEVKEGEKDDLQQLMLGTPASAAQEEPKSRWCVSWPVALSALSCFVSVLKSVYEKYSDKEDGSLFGIPPVILKTLLDLPAAVTPLINAAAIEEHGKKLVVLEWRDNNQQLSIDNLWKYMNEVYHETHKPFKASRDKIAAIDRIIQDAKDVADKLHKALTDFEVAKALAAERASNQQAWQAVQSLPGAIANVFQNQAVSAKDKLDRGVATAQTGERAANQQILTVHLTNTEAGKSALFSVPVSENLLVWKTVYGHDAVEKAEVHDWPESLADLKKREKEPQLQLLDEKGGIVACWTKASGFHTSTLCLFNLVAPKKVAYMQLVAVETKSNSSKLRFVAM